MSYTHLTIEERACIFQYKNMGMSIRSIARALNRNPSTISRELRRNKSGRKFPYHAVSAQRKYNKRRQSCHRKINLKSDVKNYIESKIDLTWSPEQIANYKCNELEFIPSCSTIYRWIDMGLIIDGDKTKLRRKGKFSRNGETRGKFNVGRPIRQRPKEVYKRKTYGHWEADTVVSGRGKSKKCFVTLVERKSRIYLAELVPNRKEITVTKSIINMLSKYPQELLRTITCDRGKEFAGYNTLEEKLNVKVYFADPYCSWQRGSNENANGLLREFYPKGMDLSQVSESEVKEKVDLINNRPRKCIGYRKPSEVINEFVSKCCT